MKTVLSHLFKFHSFTGVQINLKRSKLNKFISLGINLLLYIFMHIQAEAATFTSNNSGNWRSAIWTITNGPASQSYPTVDDEVIIAGGHTISLSNGEDCALLMFSSSASASELLFTGTYSLDVGGDIIINAPSVIDGVAKINVGSGTLFANNLTLTGSSATRRAEIIVSSGSMDIAGNIAFNGGADAVIAYTGPGTLKVSGIFESDGSFVPGSSTVIFSGNTTQNLPANYNYYNIITANDYGVVLDGPLTTNNLKGNLTVQSGTFNNGGFDINGTNNKIFNLKASAIFIASGNSTSPSGFILNDFESASIMRYTGSNQIIGACNYGNLEISGSSTKTLGGPISIINNLDLANGSIELANYNLSVKPGATILHPSATNYIKQTGTGKLIIENIGSGGITTETIFPVGTATSYTPAYITNTGILNNFSVLVANDIYNNSNIVTEHVVRKTWNVVQESSNGAANVTLKLQWNAADEGTPFDRTKTGIIHFYSGSWHDPNMFVAANGSGPYQIALTGLSSFSPFGVGDEISPLPVELMNFKVSKKGRAAFLQWETASETENNGFEIQFSSDSRLFETIGFVKSKNPNSSTRQQYEYLDKNTHKAGLKYFRLKQTDFNGTVSFSAIKVLNFDSPKENVVLYPNPFLNNFMLEMDSPESGCAAIEVTDLTGKPVYKSNQEVQKGVNILQISLQQQYPGGLYLLQVQTDHRHYSARLLKQ